MTRYQKPVYVKSYKAVFTPPDGGTPIHRTSDFTQVQANFIGAVLQKDGLLLQAAQRLCDTWNAMNTNYSYTPEVAHA